MHRRHPALRHRLLSLLAAIFVLSAAGLPAAAGPAEPLVSVSWLKANLRDDNLVVLDVRSALDGGGAEAYARSHIPGAIHTDYDKAGWRVTRKNVPFMLPTIAELEKLIGELGIDETNHVVVVPAGVHALDFGAAARVYWTLKATGVAKVSILDGGFAAWVVDSTNPVESGRNTPSPKIFTATLNRELIAEAAEVESVEKSGGATLIDARPASFYLGKEKAPAAAAYGRIRGAINLAHDNFYNARDNRLKPHALLGALAATLPGGALVAYCNTGHWAATNWFVLSEVLGRKDVRLYYGSMVDWTSVPARAVESQRTKWDDIKKALGFGA